LEDADGTEGYPGNVKATVSYTLANNGKWQISMGATTDQETPISMTQHVFLWVRITDLEEVSY
jgi:aldose 1-epimerase